MAGAAPAVQVCVYFQYEHNGCTINDVVRLQLDATLLPAMQAFAARCSGHDPGSTAGRRAGRSARHLYDFVYKDRLLDGTITARQLGMDDRDLVHVLPVLYWTRQPERTLYRASSAECALRRSVITLFTTFRARRPEEIPACAASMPSAFDERLQLHLDEPRRIPLAIYDEYLDMARAWSPDVPNKRQGGTGKASTWQASVDMHLAAMAADALCMSDVIASHGSTASSLSSATSSQRRGACLHEDRLLRELHGVFASVAPAFLVGHARHDAPLSTGRRPLALPSPARLVLCSATRACTDGAAGGTTGAAAALSSLDRRLNQRSSDRRGAATVTDLALDDDDNDLLPWGPLQLETSEDLSPDHAMPTLGRPVRARQSAYTMAAHWRCARQQEALVARAEACEVGAKHAAIEARHALLAAPLDRARDRQKTQQERLLERLLNSVARPFGGPGEGQLAATWLEYERAMPMTPLRHWLIHGKLPSASDLSVTAGLLLDLEPLLSAVLGVSSVVHGPLTPDEWREGARIMTSLEPPALVLFGCTCRQMRASTRTQCDRLQSAVRQLRKLSCDLKMAPVAARHALAINWERAKSKALRGKRSERLAGVLYACTSLVSLVLSKSSLTDAALQTLLVPIRQKALPRLRLLNLNDNPLLGDVGVAALAAVLRPPCTRCGAPFAVEDNSRRAACRMCGGAPQVSRDDAFSELRSLEIVGCGVGDAGTKALATALAPGSSAWRLDFLAIGSEGIGEAGAATLAHSLGAGAMRHAVEEQMARVWAFGSFSDACGAGFAALTQVCDRLGVVLELDHGVVWGS